MPVNRLTWLITLWLAAPRVLIGMAENSLHLDLETKDDLSSEADITACCVVDASSPLLIPVIPHGAMPQRCRPCRRTLRACSPPSPA